MTTSRTIRLENRRGFPLDVEDCSEKLLCQQSYAIKNQLGHAKPPTRVFLACPTLVLYGIRPPIIDPFRDGSYLSSAITITSEEQAQSPFWFVVHYDLRLLFAGVATLDLWEWRTLETGVRPLLLSLRSGQQTDRSPAREVGGPGTPRPGTVHRGGLADRRGQGGIHREEGCESHHDFVQGREDHFIFLSIWSIKRREM